MASLTDSRLFLEITPCSSRAALVVGNKVTAYGEFTPDAKDALAAFVAKHGAGATGVALVTPDQLHAILSNPAQASGNRDRKSWETLAAGLGHEFSGSVKVAVCDAHDGTPPAVTGDAPWVMTVSPQSALTDAALTLDEAGLKASAIRQILPAQLGAVALSLQLSESGDEVVVISIGRTSSILARVSAKGVQAVTVHSAGVDQLFESVQAGLGLKFKAAAVKLFFNESYDFGDTAEAIANSLAENFKSSVTSLGGSPTAFQLVSLLEPQRWLETALATALGLKPFNADAISLAHGSALIAEGLPSSSIGLVQAVAGHSTSLCAWLPPSVDEVVASAPAAPTPPPAPSPVATPTPAPTPAPAPAAKPEPAPVPEPKKEVPPAPEAKVEPKPQPAPVAAPEPAPKPKLMQPPPKAGSGKGKSLPKPPAPVVPRPAAPAPTPAPAPAPAPAPEVAASAAAESTPAAPADGAKSGKPMGLIIGAVVLIIAVAVGIFAISNGKAAKEKEAKIAAEEVARAAEINKLHELRLGMLRREISRDPSSFKNEYYSFEVTDKGFIRKLANASNQVLVDSAGAVNLQGSYVTPEGRRVWFYAGGVGNSTYTATVEKVIVDEDIAFKIKIIHPRFELSQIVTCLEHSVRVDVDFTPIKLQDERGSISAIYAIQLWPAALNSRQSFTSEPGSVSYPTQTGSLVLKYGSKVWQPSEKGDAQLVNVGDTGTAFYFTDASQAERRKLTYELVLP